MRAFGVVSIWCGMLLVNTPPFTRLQGLIIGCACCNSWNLWRSFNFSVTLHISQSYCTNVSLRETKELDLLDVVKTIRQDRVALVQHVIQYVTSTSLAACLCVCACLCLFVLVYVCACCFNCTSSCTCTYAYECDHRLLATFRTRASCCYCRTTHLSSCCVLARVC
jgi:hypothetical protein